MPKISVIIPLYNKAQHIARTLDSVFAQSFVDFEVIVVDDGSTDNGADIVRDYHDRRFRLIQQKNAGPGAARNRGIREARADYITFLDADDEWLPGFLEISYERLSGNESLISTVLYGFPDGYDDENYHRFEGGIWRLPNNLRPESVKCELDSIHSAGCVMCHRSIFQKYGYFYENKCSYGEDSYLWLKVLLNEPILRIDRMLMIYHIELSSLGRHSQKHFFGPKPYLTHPEEFYDICPDEYKSLLTEFLSFYALKAYQVCLGVGQRDLCENFIQNFPEMTKWKRDYFKLRVKLLFPWYYRLRRDRV